MVKISKTKLVGILNVTPDSFSDGGKFNSLNGALSQLEIMLKQGASMIDIGAESTRPNHIPVSPEEEWQRLEKILPVIVQKLKTLPLASILGIFKQQIILMKWAWMSLMMSVVWWMKIS